MAINTTTTCGVEVLEYHSWGFDGNRIAQTGHDLAKRIEKGFEHVEWASDREANSVILQLKTWKERGLSWCRPVADIRAGSNEGFRVCLFLEGCMNMDAGKFAGVNVRSNDIVDVKCWDRDEAYAIHRLINDLVGNTL